MNRREALQRTAAITGIAMTSSVSLGILKGCTPSGQPSWPPLFLKQNEIKLISALADTILPKTETPGALDMHVPEFIDLMLQDCFSTEEQNTFRDGLQSFENYVKDNFSVTFEKAGMDERQKILVAEEIRSSDYFKQNNEKSFYQAVKELTLLGFFTSEYVMQNMLDYHPVPGRYDGCTPHSAETKLYVDNNV